MSKLVSIAKILNFHGIKGEAKVGFSKQNYEFVKSLKSAFILKNGEFIPVNILSVKFGNKVAIVKFDSMNSIEDVLEVKGCSIHVEEERLKEVLEEDEFLTSDLIGMEVFEDDNKLAVVVGLSNNGSTDLLAVKTVSGKVSYVPFVKDICTDVDLDNKKIFIKNIEGLLE